MEVDARKGMTEKMCCMLAEGSSAVKVSSISATLAERASELTIQEVWEGGVIWIDFRL
jgi:hypothetical protein